MGDGILRLDVLDMILYYTSTSHGPNSLVVPKPKCFPHRCHFLDCSPNGLPMNGTCNGWAEDSRFHST